MIWGVSFALHEEAVMDSRSGRPMNANLAEYHIPVNVDVPAVDATGIRVRKFPITLDRPPNYESGGREFESLRARH